ncbi:MAG: hypothetical protein BWY49_00301 [Candidatus Omnitrophica bacterium ADurb.Bin314]|nr:MAG: hypothetical protein BWY49_00301 [Candidatus Omnitrophica bacterium ADurb.Bin314]
MSRRKKGIEDLFKVLRRDSPPRIRKTDLDNPGLRGLSKLDPDPAFAFDRLDRVEKKVQEYLADLLNIPKEFRKLGIHRTAYLDTVERRLIPHKRHSLIQNLSQRKPFPRRFGFLGVHEKLSRYIGRPAGLLHHDVERLFDVGLKGSAILLHEEHLGLAGNDRERVMDLVGDPCGKLFDRGHFCFLEPLGLGILELKIGVPELPYDLGIANAGGDGFRELPEEMEIRLVKDHVRGMRAEGDHAHQVFPDKKRDDPTGPEDVKIPSHLVGFLPGKAFEQRGSHDNMRTRFLYVLDQRRIAREQNPLRHGDRPSERRRNLKSASCGVRHEKRDVPKPKDFTERIDDHVRELLQVKVRPEIFSQIHEGHLSVTFAAEKIFLEKPLHEPFDRFVGHKRDQGHDKDRHQRMGPPRPGNKLREDQGNKVGRNGTQEEKNQPGQGLPEHGPRIP